MALSDDLRERVVEAVVVGGLSRNAAAKRFGVSIASAVRWLQRSCASGEIWPAPSARGFCRDCRLISLLQRIRPRGTASGRDGDTRAPVLIKVSASSAVF